MCCVCECLQWGHSGDGCVFGVALCKYDLRKGDLFVLSWTRVLRVKRESNLFRADNVCCCCCLPRPGPSSSQLRFPLSW